MHLKLFEVRDRMTFVPCFAFLATAGTIYPEHEAEDFLLRRAGFDPAFPMVIFGKLEVPEDTRYDPQTWGDRTMRTAHEFVMRDWHGLASGDVIDVEYILGERKEPKISERLR